MSWERRNERSEVRPLQWDNPLRGQCKDRFGETVSSEQFSTNILIYIWTLQFAHPDDTPLTRREPRNYFIMCGLPSLVKGVSFGLLTPDVQITLLYIFL